MFKGLIVSLVMAASSVGFAAPSIVDVVTNLNQNVIMEQASTQGLNWKVGDTANYSIDMGFLKGTMVMSVREIGADGIWIDQNVDLGFAGKQKMSALIDQNTGEIKKLIVNGKEQAPPKNDMEVVEVTEDKITVPAGTFECIHAKMKNKENGEISNVWVNPAVVPLSGMLKTIQPSQMGEVTMLLTSFKKN